MIGHTNYTELAHAITDNYPDSEQEREVTFMSEIVGLYDAEVTVQLYEDGEGEVMRVEIDGYDITDAPELKCRFDGWIGQAKEIEV